MTLPNERRNSVNYTREFLKDLLDPKITPRVPKYVRNTAHSLLKHYPQAYEMEKARKLAPEIFGEWDSERKES